MDFSTALVEACALTLGFDLEVHRELGSMQPGDVLLASTDFGLLERDFGFKLCIGLQDDLRYAGGRDRECMAWRRRAGELKNNRNQLERRTVVPS